MISGVVLVLFGEALVLRSMPHAGWAAAFLVANLVYIPLLEEPVLEDRFGEPYREYCRNFPRFFPRLRPWEPRCARGRAPRSSRWSWSRRSTRSRSIGIACTRSSRRPGR